MISRSARLCLAVALAATLPGATARAADAPEDVAPITFGPAGALAQVVPAEAEEVASIGFSLSYAARDVALAQVKAGTLTLEAAWQSGALNYQNIADLFETQTNPWIIHERESDRGLHHQLIALLLQHEGAKLENLPQVPQRLRLWLADYYETQRDPRCVSVAQSILDELSPPTTSGQNMLAYQALERVSWFYRDTQQNEKCAQEWLSWRAYVNSPERLMANLGA